MKTGEYVQTLSFLLIGLILILGLSSCGNEQMPTSTSSIEIGTHIPITTSSPTQTNVDPIETMEPTLPEPSRAAVEAVGTEASALPTQATNPATSPMPTADLDRPLNTNGPWLVYKIEKDLEVWYIVNMDGTGRTKIENPTDKPGPVIIPSMSSNYIAIQIRESEPDFNSIYIIHIPDMEIVRIIDRISYPGLLDSTAYTNSDTGTRPALREDPVWSPDGRYLAFVGTIEGPSSDVYIYDTLGDAVRRLTSGEHHAVELMWSPNSQWIVHQEVAIFGAGCNEIAAWAVSTNGEVILRLYEPCFDHLLGWLGPAQYMSYNHEMEGARNIRYVDLHQGQVTYLFEGLYFGGSNPFDPVNGTVAFVPMSSDPRTPNYTAGTYMVSPDHPTPRYISSKSLVFNWDSNLKRLITKDIPCEDGFVAAIRLDGNIECIQKSNFKGEVSWSPNGQWAIPIEFGNELYNKDSEKVRRFTNDQVDEILWRSDSAGVFLRCMEQLLYLEIPDGEILLVDNHHLSELSWVGLEQE